MPTPKQYQSAAIKITYYSHHDIYTAGTKARVKVEKMVGIKNGEIVPIEDPDSIPYLIISNKAGRRGIEKWYAVTENDYYNVERSHNYRTQETQYRTTDKQTRTKLTELHQAVAKRVIHDFLKDKLNETASV